MEECLHLAVYDPQNDGLLVPVAAYLGLYRADQVGWKPWLKDCALLLHAQGREWSGDEWNWGELELVARQFEAASARLVAGQEALVRSGVFEQLVPYLFLEPGAEGTVQLSLFLIEDVTLAYTFPIPGVCGDSAALYAYVQGHREALLRPVAGVGAESYFRRLPVARQPLLAALQREAQAAQQLIAMLDGG